MHTIKVKPIESNFASNQNSHLASQGEYSSHSQASAHTTGSRKAAAVFYGMEPEELSKSAYARMKQAPKLETKFPRQVRSGAFRINTGLNQNTEFQKNKVAFFQQSENGSSRHGIGLRDDRLTNSRLAQAGSNLVRTPVEDTESQRFKKSEKAFYLIPSSHASRVGEKPLSQQNVENNQKQHIEDITGPSRRALATKNPLSNYNTNPIVNVKIESSASMKADRKAFFLVDSRVSFCY
jgi:hypothetical protein